ncbi:MAG TPA: SusC/RagA family TonB-linked outer membrane protein [Chitinophagaceae bacterium]|jgi:TonB-linked SusC/RagA family outer membrane protein|nr:SusC/RagA family TonB-linked outer membrane protein [Chitinophagaceae bacterium]
MRKLLFLLMGMVCLTVQVWAQRVVTGKVTDDKGNPLPNASVLVKGTTTGTATKPDGTYSITVPANAKALIFSSVNMTTIEMPLGKETTLNASLQPEDKTLSEVVVVGYGTQRKKEVTGNISSVKGSEISEKPVQSFDQALAGRAPGVQITMTNSVLNSPPIFRIRGTNSISLSSYPLIVVDGVPTYAGDYSGTNAGGNALASINVNDIESIDIAKDAAATAIYGSSAANGVVFITTKKGKPGKAKVNYDGWVGLNQVTRLPGVLTAPEYLIFKSTAVANYNADATALGLSPTTVSYNSINGPDGKPVDTRWRDYIYRQGFSHSHSVSISGGNDASTYYFSSGYTAQEGIIKKNNFERLNVLFNGDTKVNNYLSVGIKAAYSNEKNTAATSSGSLSGEAFNTAGLGRLAIVLPPIISPYNNDGSYNLNGSAIGSSNITGIASLSYFNPVPALDLNRSNSEMNHIQSSAYIQVKPVKWVTLKSLYSIDYLLVDNDLFWNPFAGDGYSYNGYASAWSTRYKTMLWDNTAQFDYTFAAKHNVTVLIGNEQRRRTTISAGINRQGLSDLAYDVIQAGWVNNNPAGMGYGENYMLSSFGRLEYNFNRKYYVQGNIRQDEYSGLGQKKGVFWGASAGWEIAKENFWAEAGMNKIFSSFKLRGSYGKVGNIAGIGDYTPYSTFGSGLYGGASTLTFSSVGNPDLKWETSKKTDVGFSFGLFKDKLTGSFAYYKNNVDGLILYVAQAPSTGLPSNPPQNVGSLYNKGVEVSLDAEVLNKKDFTWNTSFTFSTNKNKVTALAPGLTVIQTGTSGLETVNQTMVGYSLGYLWVVRTGGVDPTTGKRIFINSAGTPVYFGYLSRASAGTYQYSTTSDGKTQYISPKGGTAINAANDAVMYANAIPKQVGGWNNTINYKQFQLDFLFTYQFGFYLYYGTNAGLHDQRWWNNSSDVLTDAWSAKGDVNKKYARPVYNDNVSNGSAIPLDINVFKGDFVKLKTLTLSYTLPKSIVSKAKLSNLRIYLSAQNLLILTKYPGPDPEVSSNGNSTSGQGVDRNTAGNGRTILAGINISF